MTRRMVWGSGLVALIALIVGCSGGGDSNGAGTADAGGTAAGGAGGSASGSGGSAGVDVGGAGSQDAAATGGAPGATGGATGTGGALGMGGASGTLPAAPAGEHFCACDLTEAGAWAFGKQKVCRVSWAKTGTLTDQQKKALDYGCEAPFCKVASSCPRTAPDVVGLCVGVDSPVIPTRTYVFVEKANITPDATAFALNATAICGSPPYDLAGNPVMTKCSGSVNAKVDGVATDFSKNLLCWWKSDGVKSEYFVSAQNATQDKSFTFVVHEEGGKYTIPGNAIMPGAGYLEGNQTYAFPKDADKIAVNVTKFMPVGAGLAATFSPGELWSQPGGKGKGPKVITEGTIDVTITP